MNRAPGSGKPCSNKHSSDSPSPSLFGEISSSLSISSSNTPPSTEDGFLDFGTNSDPTFLEKNTTAIGVIGGEMKAVHSNVE